MVWCEWKKECPMRPRCKLVKLAQCLICVDYIKKLINFPHMISAGKHYQYSLWLIWEWRIHMVWLSDILVMQATRITFMVLEPKWPLFGKGLPLEGWSPQIAGHSQVRSLVEEVDYVSRLVNQYLKFIQILMISYDIVCLTYLHRCFHMFTKIYIFRFNNILYIYVFIYIYMTFVQKSHFSTNEKKKRALIFVSIQRV